MTESHWLIAAVDFLLGFLLGFGITFFIIWRDDEDHDE